MSTATDFYQLVQEVNNKVFEAKSASHPRAWETIKFHIYMSETFWRKLMYEVCKSSHFFMGTVEQDFIESKTISGYSIFIVSDDHAGETKHSNYLIVRTS